MAIAAGKEVERRGTGDLLSEAGSQASVERSDAEDRGGDAEDSTAPMPVDMASVMGETEMETAHNGAIHAAHGVTSG